MIELKNCVQLIGHGIKLIGHEIKENTELAEHETGIDNAKSTFSKIKKVI
jgi:hypothetical protein